MGGDACGESIVLNRVTSADEGKLASGSISNRTSKEAWTLSQTGNWSANTRDTNGNGTNDLNFSGTFNDANEWTSRTDSVAPFTENMIYDANGNMTSWGYREGDANKYTYVYDGFGRLKKVQTDISGSPWDHAVYRYNGLGYRIQWQYDENINFTLSSSERFYFLYDDRWRIVATFRDTDSSAKESFVYHAAGVAGRGGSSYIDSVILRDKDANTGWTSSGDGALEERRFYAQNWRADVVAITKSDGQPTEFIRYTSYGTAQAFAAADVNRDGTVNSTDVTDWDNLFSEASSGAAIPVDFDFDGSSFNPDDNDAFTAAYNEASGWSNGGLGAGGGKLSRIGNRKGYAGYEYDPAIVSYYVRHRVYVPEIGRWTKRDPLGYVDGMSVYEYVISNPINMIDGSGLFSAIPMPPECQNGIKNKSIVPQVVCSSDTDQAGQTCGCVVVESGGCPPDNGCDWDMYFDPIDQVWKKCNDLGICVECDGGGRCYPWDPDYPTPIRDWNPTIRRTIVGACSRACRDQRANCGAWRNCMIDCLQGGAGGSPVDIPPCKEFGIITGGGLAWD